MMMADSLIDMLLYALPGEQLTTFTALYSSATRSRWDWEGGQCEACNHNGMEFELLAKRKWKIKRASNRMNCAQEPHWDTWEVGATPHRNLS